MKISADAYHIKEKSILEEHSNWYFKLAGFPGTECSEFLFWVAPTSPRDTHAGT